MNKSSVSRMTGWFPRKIADSAIVCDGRPSAQQTQNFRSHCLDLWANWTGEI